MASHALATMPPPMTRPRMMDGTSSSAGVCLGPYSHADVETDCQNAAAAMALMDPPTTTPAIRVSSSSEWSPRDRRNDGRAQPDGDHDDPSEGGAIEWADDDESVADPPQGVREGGDRKRGQDPDRQATEPTLRRRGERDLVHGHRPSAVQAAQERGHHLGRVRGLRRMRSAGDRDDVVGAIAIGVGRRRRRPGFDRRTKARRGRPRRRSRPHPGRRARRDRSPSRRSRAAARGRR